jgi:hypothetical protein
MSNWKAAILQYRTPDNVLALFCPHYKDTTSEWQFVYDKFDNPNEVPGFRKSYVPVSRAGSIIITSRDRSVADLIDAAEGLEIPRE